MQWPIIPIKNLTSLFPLIFLSKHISLHALGRLKWVLDIIWPLNQHFNLKNQRNWIKQVLMLSFLIGIICILLHRPKKLTLVLTLNKYLVMSKLRGNWVKFVGPSQNTWTLAWKLNYPIFKSYRKYQLDMSYPVVSKDKCHSGHFR